MRYAVACLLRKEGKAKTNKPEAGMWGWAVTTRDVFMQQAHRIVTASSEDEARGKAVAHAMKQYADYDLTQVSVLEIPDPEILDQ